MDTAQALIDEIGKYTLAGDRRRWRGLVSEAVGLAQEVHEGFVRLSDNTPYYNHVLRVAQILVSWQAPPEVVAAGVLHDALKPWRCKDPSLHRIQARVGEQVAALVQAVSDLDKYEPSHFIDDPELRLDEAFQDRYVDTRLPWIVPSLQKYPEAAIIRLASRLEKLSSWQDRRAAERENYVTATLNMFVPVANRLGVWYVKRQLEDHAFRLLYPVEYAAACEQYSDEERDRKMQPVVAQLQQRLNERRIKAEVAFEPVSRYTQHFRHIKSGSLMATELAYPIRIITDTLSDCYIALGPVHELWSPVTSEFRDHIARPKTNSYRGLRTRVRYGRGATFLVVIRSREMDLVAEWGIAAGWRGVSKHLLPKPPDWKEPPKSKIVIFTIDGDSRTLPVGSTALDFAYAIDLAVGQQCAATRVNNRPADPGTELRTGDVVEILRDPLAGPPSLDCLSKAKTAKAKQGIRALLERQHSAPSVSDVELYRATLQNPVLMVRTATVDGLGVMLPNFYGHIHPERAKCCHPQPPNPIVGRLTRKRGVVIHSKGCPYLDAAPHLLLQVDWADLGLPYGDQLHVIAADGVGLVYEIASVFRKHNISFAHLSADSMLDGTARILIGMGPVAPAERERVIAELKKDERIMQVTPDYSGIPIRYAVGSRADRIHTNPYSLEPVTGQAFFGRDNEIQELVLNLRRAHHSESILLWGPRRIGKTSLLLEFSRQVRVQSHSYLPVYVDMEKLGANGKTVHLLQVIAEQIAAGIDHPIITAPGYGALRRDPLGAFRSFMEYVHAHGKRELILMLDEFELLSRLQEEGVSFEDIVRYLRSLAQSDSGVDFIFCGGGRLAVLQRHAGISPLLNVAHFQKIGCLDFKNAQRLITEPVEPFATYGDNVVDRLLSLTGGHPFYLQLLLGALAKRVQGQTKATLDEALLDRVLQEWLPGQPEYYFWHLWGTDIGLDEADVRGYKLLLAAMAESRSACLTRQDIHQLLNAFSLASEDVDELLKGLLEIETLVDSPQGYRFRVDLARQWIRENLSSQSIAREEFS